MHRFHLRWVPHNLSSNRQSERISYSSFLRAKIVDAEQTDFERIITEDKSWFFVLYPHDSTWAGFRDEFPQRVRQDIESAKCLISILWSVNGMHSLIEISKGITYHAVFFCEQIDPNVVVNIASRGHFQSNDFHVRCNGRPYILIIILTMKGNISHWKIRMISRQREFSKKAWTWYFLVKNAEIFEIAAWTALPTKVDHSYELSHHFCSLLRLYGTIKISFRLESRCFQSNSCSQIELSPLAIPGLKIMNSHTGEEKYRPNWAMSLPFRSVASHPHDHNHNRENIGCKKSPDPPGLFP
jgi:hypothetical protein